MYSAENAGLIKFDFLGLKTLTVINKTKMVKKFIKILILKKLIIMIKRFLIYYQKVIQLDYFN